MRCLSLPPLACGAAPRPWRRASGVAPPRRVRALGPQQEQQQQQQEQQEQNQQNQQQQSQQQQSQQHLRQEGLRERLAGCPQCGGSGRCACKECEGRGFLKRGGYTKRNPLPLNRIIGSKWTAMASTLGWRHFRVVQQRRLAGDRVFLLLQASCSSSAQLWVAADVLRSRSAWASGWLQMSEIASGGAMPPVSRGAHKCQACAGLGAKPCLACDGTGRAQLIVL